MDITRQRSVSHRDEKDRLQAMFSCSASADSRFLCTGALDSTCSVWSLPDLSPASVGMSRHEGAVLVVRFNPNTACAGTFASAGDDRRVLIWDAVSAAPGSHDVVFKVRQRLPPVHSSDITALEWSADGQFLLTASLDKSIVLWSLQPATNLFVQCDRQETGGFVKGLAVWGENVIVQSDDKRVCLYKVSSKSEENGDSGQAAYRLQLAPHTLSFPAALDSVFFSRPSFSPDGQLVALANACNGPISSVCLASVSWFSQDQCFRDSANGNSSGLGNNSSSNNYGGCSNDDNPTDMLSLIGHYSAIEVAKFSPVLYNSDDGATNSSLSGDMFVCLGGQDGSVSMWSSARSNPLFVLTDLSDQSVTDIAWSSCGRIMYISFYEGFIAKLSLDAALTGAIGRPLRAPRPLEREEKEKKKKNMEDTLLLPPIPDRIPPRAAPGPAAKRRITPTLLNPVSINVASTQQAPSSQSCLHSTQQLHQHKSVTVKFEAGAMQRFQGIARNVADPFTCHYDLPSPHQSIVGNLHMATRVEIAGVRIQCSRRRQQANAAPTVFWRETLTKPAVFSTISSDRRFLAVLQSDGTLLTMDGVTGRRVLPQLSVEAVSLIRFVGECDLALVMSSGQIVWFSDRFSQLVTAHLPSDIIDIPVVEMRQEGFLYVTDGQSKYLLSRDDHLWCRNGQLQTLEEKYRLNPANHTIDDIKCLLKTHLDDGDADIVLMEEHVALSRLIGDEEQAAKWAAIHDNRCRSEGRPFRCF